MMRHEHTLSYPLYLYYSYVKYLYAVIMDVKQNTKKGRVKNTHALLSDARRAAGVLLLSFQTQISPYLVFQWLMKVNQMETVFHRGLSFQFQPVHFVGRT